MTVNIDWNNLGFDIIKTKSFIQYIWRDGKWNAGELVSDRDQVLVNLYSSALHYGQACFEGLKAFRSVDNKIRIFRPELNAERMQRSCHALSMPSVPTDIFLEALFRVVKDNAEYVPPASSNGSMYIRPFVVGSGGVIGLEPAKEFLFIIAVNPVGDYYKGGMGSACKALIQYGFDRAAPNGNGHVKLAGNYAPVLGPTNEAKKKGYQINLFLDPKTGKYIEEFATSNFAALTTPDAQGKRTYITPKSNSILPSITNRSLCELAALHFGWKVCKRKIEWREVSSGAFDEVAACGTAVIITPIGQIDREIPEESFDEIEQPLEDITTMWDIDQSKPAVKIESVKFPACDYAGFKQLYITYRQIQYGKIPDSFGWMYPAQGI